MQLLQAVSQTLKYFLPFLIWKLFLVRTNITAVVAYIINIQGRLHSWHIAAPGMISWSNSHLASVRATHVSGKLSLGPGWISALPLQVIECALLWSAHCMHMWTKQLDLGNESNWLYLGLCSTWASHHKTKVAKLDCGGYCLVLWGPRQ